MPLKKLSARLMLLAGLLFLVSCAPVRDDEPYYGSRRGYPYPHYYRDRYHHPYYGHPYSRLERDDSHGRGRKVR